MPARFLAPAVVAGLLAAAAPASAGGPLQMPRQVAGTDPCPPPCPPSPCPVPCPIPSATVCPPAAAPCPPARPQVVIVPPPDVVIRQAGPAPACAPAEAGPRCLLPSKLCQPKAPCAAPAAPQVVAPQVVAQPATTIVPVQTVQYVPVTTLQAVPVTTFAAVSTQSLVAGTGVAGFGVQTGGFGFGSAPAGFGAAAGFGFGAPGFAGAGAFPGMAAGAASDEARLFQLLRTMATLEAMRANAGAQAKPSDAGAGTTSPNGVNAAASGTTADATFNDLKRRLDTLETQAAQRFDRIDQAFGKTAGALEALDKRLNDLEKRCCPPPPNVPEAKEGAGGPALPGPRPLVPAVPPVVEPVPSKP